MEKIRKNAGPILYVASAISALWFFYWFSGASSY